ncbi:MAG: NAD(P)-dependent oxidoreductase [Eubacterium sp.]|nr:NAD(P)-dependent oxidoreductase [Eubacterium sp.]
MKILLTGADGFIGQNLKNKLKDKFDIVCPLHSEIDLLDSEIVYQYLKEKKFDIVLHSANINTTRNTAPTFHDALDGNLRMFFNLERCKGYYKKMYYFGSGAEYDMEHYIPYMKEDYFDTHVPKDSYGFSKYIMSKTCEQSNNIYDLRLFGVYGKYEEWERRFISNAICRALMGKNITIQKNVYFDYLWIDDLCNIMLWFIENTPAKKHYNVCRGSKMDLYSLACLVREILNIDCDIIVSEPGWKPEYTGNNERLLAEIGNYQFTGFKESITVLCEYYKGHIDLIDVNKL